MSSLKGKTVVLIGQFKGTYQHVVKEFLEEKGVYVDGFITEKTDLVVVGDDTPDDNPKLKWARSKKVQIVSENDLTKMLLALDAATLRAAERELENEVDRTLNPSYGVW